MTASSFLEKKIKKKADLNHDETIQLAIEALQSSLGIETRSKDLEVVVVSKQDHTFKYVQIFMWFRCCLFFTLCNVHCVFQEADQRSS